MEPYVLYYCVATIHLYSASRSAHQSEALPLTRLYGLSNCMQAIVCKELVQGPYTETVADVARTRTLHVTGRASALTDRPPCHTTTVQATSRMLYTYRQHCM